MNEIINIQNQKLLYTQAISIIEGGRQNIIDFIYKKLQSLTGELKL
jgi:hypothetical protein